MLHSALSDMQWRRIQLPLFRRGANQHLARRRTSAPDNRHCRRSCPATRRRAVVGGHSRIRKHYLNGVWRNVKFFRRSLSNLRARALPDINLAGQHRDRAVLTQMQPRRRRDRILVTALAIDHHTRRRHQQAHSDRTHPITPIQLEPMLWTFVEFLAVGLE